MIRARETNSAIVEAIHNSITTAVLELDRARDLRWNVTRSFMATKSTITPREFLGPHVHGGIVAKRRRITERPIRTVCAWCAGHDRPAAVLVDVPIDDRGLSHGICSPCRSSLLSNRVAFAVARSGPAVSPR